MGNDYDYYNLIEGNLLEIEQDEKKLNDFQICKIAKEIKGLAMCLSRFNPADWNKFLDVVIT